MTPRCSSLMAAAIALAGFTPSAFAGIVTVYANNPSPGDAFTYAGGPPGSGQAVGATGWAYNNVRLGGTIGINTTNPRSGNGSVLMFTPTSAKADIEYYNGSFVSPVSMGKLSDLNALSYDWYRNSSSGADAWLHPAMRIMVDADGDFTTLGDRGYLVFEREYNHGGTGHYAAPTDTWVPNDIYNFNGVGDSANLWMVNFGNPSGPVLEIFDRNLQDWVNSNNPNSNYPSLQNAVVYGLSAGLGSGWNGTFTGAVDNITIGFTGSDPTTYNFEVRSAGPAPVPEPASLALFGAGLAGVLFGQRRRRKAVA